MNEKLQNEVDRFYKEMEMEDSTDIGELSCSLVPKLVGLIKSLELKIDKLTSESNIDSEKEAIKLALSKAICYMDILHMFGACEKMYILEGEIRATSEKFKIPEFSYKTERKD